MTQPSALSSLAQSFGTTPILVMVGISLLSLVVIVLVGWCVIRITAGMPAAEGAPERRKP